VDLTIKRATVPPTFLHAHACIDLHSHNYADQVSSSKVFSYLTACLSGKVKTWWMQDTARWLCTSC